jgi:protein-tyrosine phosphatase
VVARHRQAECAPLVDGGAGEPCAILFVCTANLCRSPMAEAVTEHLVGKQFPGACVRAESAGLDVPEGLVTPHEVAEVLGERGVSFRPRGPQTLTAGMLDSADLILTAERSQRGRVVRLAPSAMHQTFTLGEFARVAGAVAGDAGGEGSSRGLVGRAAASRALVRPADPAEDDLPDPYGGPVSGYRSCADRIEASLQRVLPLLLSR